MEPLPEIATNNPGIVVDDITYCQPWLGLFGSPYWQITWRSVENPDLQSVTRLPCDGRAGSADLAGQSFAFTVRWRRDLRRRRCIAASEDGVVTPGGVLQLARERLP